jgi:hypothetical protein
MSDMSLFCNTVGAKTNITHKPCSINDDSSQISQYFEILLGDQGPSVYYLGGPHSQAKNVNGYLYGNTYGTVGKPYTIVRNDTSPDDDDVAFYLY